MGNEKIATLLPNGFTLADLAKVPDDMIWDDKMVERRLIEAVRIAEAAVKSPRPKNAVAAWPSHLYDADDLLGQTPDESGAGRVVPRFRITEMEEAIMWQAKYLKGHDGPARVLRTYIRCKVYRISFNEVVKQKGWSRASAYRARAKALSLIAYCLMRDGVPPVRGGE